MARKSSRRMLDSQKREWYTTVHWVSNKRVAGEEKRRHQEKKQRNPPANAGCREIIEDYPERMLDARFAQPRWTTVLLWQVRMGMDQGQGQSRGLQAGDLLGKHVDHTSSQSLVTHTTNPLLRDGDMTSSSPAAPNTFTQGKLGLGLHIACFAQASHDTGLVEDRIGCSHPALEIKFEFAHGQRGGN